MKKLSVIIVLIALSFSACDQKATSKIKTSNLEEAKKRDEIRKLGNAIIDFDQRVYDFGTIDEGDVVEGAFTVFNKGKVDLIITSASASCGCTVPVWPKEAIPPGASSELTFKFNSRGRSGKQSKSITIKSNAEKMQEVLRVSGNVNKKES